MTNEELCVAIQSGTGDRLQLLEQLYLQNTGMIERIIKRYQEIEDLEDLRQESFFGIAHAADLWDPESGTLFISYAVYWIRAAVRRYIENCSGAVRVPSETRSMITRYRNTVNAYSVKFGRAPTEKELCDELRLFPDQLDAIRKAAQALNVRSTSEIVGGENDDLTLEDTIADDMDTIGDALEAIQAEQQRAALWNEVNQLDPQQAAVIQERYRAGRTLKECSAAIGTTPGKAKRIEYKALQALREPPHVQRIKPYWVESAAYSVGISNTGYSVFERLGSSQEIAVMRLEQRAGMNLQGVKFPAIGV